VGKEVSFSFKDEEERDRIEALARSRGLSLSQFCRWCVYKYLRDREINTAGNRSRRAAKAVVGDLSE